MKKLFFAALIALAGFTACGTKNVETAATEATEQREVGGGDIAYVQVEAVLAQSDLYNAEGIALKDKTEKAQQGFLDQGCETDALIYISTTPWFDLTSCTNERDFDKDDAIPRITWGKYVPENGREMLGMSLEVSHRFIDGYHLGQFYQTLQKSIDEL